MPAHNPWRTFEPLLGRAAGAWFSWGLPHGVDWNGCAAAARGHRRILLKFFAVKHYRHFSMSIARLSERQRPRGMPVLFIRHSSPGLERLFSGANVGPHFQVLAIVANQCFVMVQTGAACFDVRLCSHFFV